MIGRLKYMQLSFSYPSLAHLRMKWLLKNEKDINQKVLDKIFVHAGGRTYRYILFKTRKTCLNNGRRPLLYVVIRRVIKLIVVINEAYKFYPAVLCQGQFHV
jgi:hypothetical protein